MNVRDPFLDSMEIHGCFKSDDSWKERTPRSKHANGRPPLPMGANPCDACDNNNQCKTEKLACRAYEYWITSEANAFVSVALKRAKDDRNATRKTYQRIFMEEV